jgi:hypothetical protein
VRLQTIFCEDIRTENLGKVSLMGVFNGAVLVPGFPTVLPRFAIRMILDGPPELHNQPWFVKIVLGDQIIAQIESGQVVPSPTLDKLGNFQCAIVIGLDGLVVKEECEISITATTPDTTVVADPFLFRVAKPLPQT